MKNAIISFILLLVLTGLWSCSTEVDIYADYQDITIVYGLTDIDDDTTFIKITKAFTGPGNALLIAHNADSSNYPYMLDATLTGSQVGGTILEPIVLDTITIHNKELTEYVIDENGDTIILHPFYSPDQLMYYTTEPLLAGYDYTLTINNKGKEIKGTTPMISNFSISSPVNRISFATNVYVDPSIEWVSVKNGKRYEVSLTFHYQELQPNSIDTLDKSISWFLGTRTSDNTDGGQDMSLTYSGNTFFTLLENNLSHDPFIRRWAGKCDIHIAAGSQELETYLAINNATGSLLEEIPTYSNMDGAIGIFASRHNALRSMLLSTQTITELVDDHDLGFQMPQ